MWNLLLSQGTRERESTKVPGYLSSRGGQTIHFALVAINAVR